MNVELRLRCLSHRTAMAFLGAILASVRATVVQIEESTAAVKTVAFHTRLPQLPSAIVASWLMNRRVLRSRHDLKIGKSIVEGVSVDVMNMLMGCQWASQMLFHNVAMFHLQFIANPYPPISVVDVTGSPAFATAFGGTELCGIASRRGYMERCAALFTNHIWDRLWTCHGVTPISHFVVPCSGLLPTAPGLLRASILPRIAYGMSVLRHCRLRAWFEQTGLVTPEDLLTSSPTVAGWVNDVKRRKARRGSV